MTAPQAVVHCSIGLEIALGLHKPPRRLLWLPFSPIIRRLALGNDEPMRRNSPTVDGMVVTDERDLALECERLLSLIDRFATGTCTTHPHAYLGALTPAQWSVLMYKHLDHHLRQFGV